jgi:hypothetical protein
MGQSTGGKIMDFRTFKDSLSQEQPPEELNAPLRALWLDAKGDWEGAHDALQGQPDRGGAGWVHAYLHRVEGDLSNARYWYTRAGKPESTQPLDVEWEQIAKELLVQDG